MLIKDVVQDETDGEITDTYSPLTMIKAKAKHISGQRDWKIEQALNEEQETVKHTPRTKNETSPTQNKKTKKV